jgi:hypothetical protein
LSDHIDSTPTLTTVFLTHQFGSAPWAWLFGICIASATFPVLLTPVQYLINLLASSVINASVLPPSIIFILVYTPSYALFASTNLATVIFGVRLRGLFRSSFYRADLRQTPVTRAQIFDSILAIAIPAALILVFGEIISATLSFILRNLGNFLRDFRLEYILYPRIVRIEAMAAMRFEFYQTLFAAASTLNAVRVIENALLLVAGSRRVRRARGASNSAILRTVRSRCFVIAIHQRGGRPRFHTYLLLPIDICNSPEARIRHRYAGVRRSLACTAPLLYFLAVKYVTDAVCCGAAGD